MPIYDVFYNLKEILFGPDCDWEAEFYDIFGRTPEWKFFGPIFGSEVSEWHDIFILLKRKLGSRAAACKAIRLEMASNDKAVKRLSEMLQRNGITPSNMNVWTERLAEKGYRALEEEVLTGQFAKEVDNKELQEELKNEKAANEKLKNEIRQKEANIKNLKDRAVDHEANKKLQNELNEKETNQKLQEEVKNEKAANKKLQSELKEQEITNKNLQSEIKNQQIADEKLRYRLAARKKQNIELRNALDKKAVEIEQLENKVTSLESQVNNLTITPSPKNNPISLPDSASNQSTIPWNLLLVSGTVLLVFVVVILLSKAYRRYSDKKLVVTPEVFEEFQERFDDELEEEKVDTTAEKPIDNSTSEMEYTKLEKMEDDSSARNSPATPKQKTDRKLPKADEILSHKALTEIVLDEERLNDCLAQPFAFRDKKDDQGNTLLHIAAQRLMLDLVSRLLKKGADPESLNSELCTPLHMIFSTTRGSKENQDVINTLSLLLRRAKNKQRLLNLQNSSGKTILHLAILQNESILEFIKNTFIDPNLKDKDGRTALNIIIEAVLKEKKYINSLRLLLEFENVFLEKADENLVKFFKNSDMVACVDDVLNEHKKERRKKQMLLHAFQILQRQKITSSRYYEWVTAIFDTRLLKFLITLDNYTAALNVAIGMKDQELAGEIANEICKGIKSERLKSKFNDNQIVEIFRSRIDSIILRYEKGPQKVNTDRNNIAVFENKIKLFRETFKAIFNTFFGFYRGIAYNKTNIARKNLEKLAVFSEIATELSTVMEMVSKELAATAGTASALFRTALTFFKGMDDVKQQVKAERFVTAFANGKGEDCHADVIKLEKVVNRITYRYFDQIVQLDEKGLNGLIQIMILRIVNYFRAEKNKGKPGEVEEYCLEALFTEKNKNCDSKQISRGTNSELDKKIVWSADEILCKSGIKRKNLEMYAVSLSNFWNTRSSPEFYGYMRVTEEEFSYFEKDTSKVDITDPFKDYAITLAFLLEDLEKKIEEDNRNESLPAQHFG